MSAQEMAKKLYNDAYMRWCYELSDDKNRATARNAATYVCDQIILALSDALGNDIIIPHVIYWNRVKEEITNLVSNNDNETYIV